MSDISVHIHQIIEPVINHPEADMLSVIKVADNVCVSRKLDDGTPRYKQGDYIAYIPENSILPEWLLKRLDFWDEEKGKGTLSGAKGNRLKKRNFRGIESKGMLYHVFVKNKDSKRLFTIETENNPEHVLFESELDDVSFIDIASILDITGA